MVVQKRINFGWRRRQPGEIERQTANQRGSLGFRRRAEAFALKPIQNKIVDLSTRPILVLNNGTGGALWREILASECCPHLAPCSIQRRISSICLGQLPPGGGRAYRFAALPAVMVAPFHFSRDRPGRWQNGRPDPAWHRLRRSKRSWSGGSIYPVHGRCSIDPTGWAACHEMWSLSQRFSVRISGLPRGY